MLDLETYDATVLPYSTWAEPELPAVPLNQEGRILAALGKHRGALPHVSAVWLARYYDYLASTLSFPFEASCPEETGALRLWKCAVSVVELLAPSGVAQIDDSGLLCKALRRGTEIEVPLIDLEVAPEHANAPLIEDYWYWFWNWRFDPRI
jgi:hypothetical protein